MEKDSEGEYLKEISTFNIAVKSDVDVAKEETISVKRKFTASDLLDLLIEKGIIVG